MSDSRRDVKEERSDERERDAVTGQRHESAVPEPEDGDKLGYDARMTRERLRSTPANGVVPPTEFESVLPA